MGANLHRLGAPATSWAGTARGMKSRRHLPMQAMPAMMPHNLLDKLSRNSARPGLRSRWSRNLSVRREPEVIDVVGGVSLRLDMEFVRVGALESKIDRGSGTSNIL